MKSVFSFIYEVVRPKSELAFQARISHKEVKCRDGLKLCLGCNIKKSLNEFHSKGQGRHETRCKICSNKRKKKKREQKKKKEKRKRAKNQTLKLSGIEIMGKLDTESINEFGKAYGNIIREILDDAIK